MSTALIRLARAADSGCGSPAAGARSAPRPDGSARTPRSPPAGPARTRRRRHGEASDAPPWSHTLRSVRPGGTVVVTGATSGADPVAHLNRIFWNELKVVGSTSGTLDELRRLLALMTGHGLRPDIAAELPFAERPQGASNGS
ncbi:hypothetical protein ACRAWF_30530 [Streptomyces sp. L7]